MHGALKAIYTCFALYSNLVMNVSDLLSVPIKKSCATAVYRYQAVYNPEYSSYL